MKTSFPLRVSAMLKMSTAPFVVQTCAVRNEIQYEEPEQAMLLCSSLLSHSSPSDAIGINRRYLKCHLAKAPVTIKTAYVQTVQH